MKNFSISMTLSILCVNQAFLGVALRKGWKFKATRTFASLCGRISANGVTLNANLIVLNKELVKSHLESRKVNNLDAHIDEIILLQNKRRSNIRDTEQTKHKKKVLSDQIRNMKQHGESEEKIGKVMADSKSLDQTLILGDKTIEEVNSRITHLLNLFPNLLDDKVPEGGSDSDNLVISEWATSNRKIGDTFAWHDDIAINLGGLNNDAAVKMSGSRFSILQGDLAKLERSIIQYFLDFHTSRGYVEYSVPFIVSTEALEGTGQLPKFADDLFQVHHQIHNNSAYLIPTAEVPLTNMFRDTIVDSSELPLKLVSHTPCFRSEVGSHGRDSRGLLRQHQFHKVELVKITSPESSAEEHERMCEDAEAVLRSLNLPYRKVLLCGADTGFSARITHDLEVWMPGQQLYREISSVSNCHDFQANRMNLRYKPVAASNLSKKTVLLHTINGSGLAVGR